MFRHHRQPHVSADFGGSCCPRVAPGNPSSKLGYGRLAQTSCAASLNAGPWQRPADGPTRRYSLDRMMLLRVATQPAYGKGLKRTSVSTSRRRTRTQPEGWLFVGATSTKQRGAGVSWWSVAQAPRTCCSPSRSPHPGPRKRGLQGGDEDRPWCHSGREPATARPRAFRGPAPTGDVDRRRVRWGRSIRFQPGAGSDSSRHADTASRDAGDGSARAAEGAAATTHRVVPHSKARPEKKKAVVHTRVAVKKPSVKPAVTFLPNPPLVNPVVPAGGRDSSWNLSDADILLIAFLLPLAVALLAWQAGACCAFSGGDGSTNVRTPGRTPRLSKTCKPCSNHG